MTPPPDAQRRLYLAEIARHALALRECLVRHDENLSAWRVLDALPRWLYDADESLGFAWRDQRQMVLHLLDPDEYQRYYATNPHERPFEEQYGIPVEQAGAIPRFKWLADMLGAGKPPIRMLDLGCCDGAMLAYLKSAGVQFDGRPVGVDLNPTNADRAHLRGVDAALGRVELAPKVVGGGFDCVTLFEVVEHVLDPAAAVAAAAACAKPGGIVCVSCPEGAIEQGWLPDWDRVERKGHVRTLSADDLRRLLDAAGLDVEQLVRFSDNTMAAMGRQQ